VARISSQTREQANTGTLTTQERAVMRQPIFALVMLAGLHVCGNSQALAQTKLPSSAGAVVRSADDFADEQMALMHRQIDSARKQLIAANLKLTDAEAANF